MRPSVEIDACRRGHELLLHDVRAISEDEMRAKSLLPGFSRGHVVAHLTNKARAHLALIEGARQNEVRRLHPAGYDPDTAAEKDAGRPAAELCVALTQSLDALEAAWGRLDEAEWSHRGIMMAGPRTMSEIVAHHLRNIEVHHVDLDVGYRPTDWPTEFIEGELSRRLPLLPDRANHADLLAWLLDRQAAPRLDPW